MDITLFLSLPFVYINTLMVEQPRALVDKSDTALISSIVDFAIIDRAAWGGDILCSRARCTEDIVNEWELGTHISTIAQGNLSSRCVMGGINSQKHHSTQRHPPTYSTTPSSPHMSTLLAPPQTPSRTSPSQARPASVLDQSQRGQSH